MSLWNMQKHCGIVHWDQQGNSKWRNEGARESTWYCEKIQLWGCQWAERLYDGWLLKLQGD